MATEIVFGDGATVVVAADSPADLAQEMSQPEGLKWAGNYIYLSRSEGGPVWVNPAAVAYLREA